MHAQMTTWHGNENKHDKVTFQLAVMKQYEIITLRYIGKAWRLCLIYFGAPEDIIL